MHRKISRAFGESRMPPMEFHPGCDSDAAKPNVDVSVVAINGERLFGPRVSRASPPTRVRRHCVPASVFWSGARPGER